MAGLSIYLGCLSMLVGVAFGSTAAPDVMYTTLTGKGTYGQTEGDCKNVGEDFHVPKYNKDDQRMVRDAMKENVPEAWISMSRTRYPMWKWLDNVPVDHNFAQQDWKPHMNCGVLHLRDNVVEVDNCTYGDFGFVCELPGGKDCLSMGVQETNCRVVGKRTFVLFCSSQNWYDALYQCRRKGMDLAVVKSGNIQADLSANWYRQTKECSQVWIGLRREDWNYTSPDEKHIIQYHWAPGQPSQVGDCAVLYKKPPQDWYLWKSVDCNSQQGRVCVRRIEQETTETTELTTTRGAPLVQNVHPTQGGSSNLGVAIGIPVLLLILGVIAAVAFLVIRRRKNKERRGEEGIDPTRQSLLNDEVKDNVSMSSSFVSWNEPDVNSDPVVIGAEKVFDSSGGKLVIDDSDVVLHVPHGAVPKEKKFTIKAQVFGDINVPSLLLPGGEQETVISPLLEITSTGTFDKHVTLIIPHKIYQKEQQKDIKAYFRKNSSAKWKHADVPLFEKARGIFADVFYKVSANAVLIETKHFTQFICTCKADTRHLGLTGVLFAKYRDTGTDPMEQEVQLNVFVLEAVHSTRETLKALESEAAQNGTHQRMNMQIDLSDEKLRSEDRLLIKLETQEEWSYITEEQKEKNLHDVVSCHKPQLWALAAEFVLQRDKPYKEALDGTRITLTFTVDRVKSNSSPKQTKFTQYIPFNKRQKRRHLKVKGPDATMPDPTTTPVTKESEDKTNEENTKSREAALPEKVTSVEDKVKDTDINEERDQEKENKGIVEEKDIKAPCAKELQQPDQGEPKKKENREDKGAAPDGKKTFSDMDTEKEKPTLKEVFVEDQNSERVGIDDPCIKVPEQAVEATESVNLKDDHFTADGVSAEPRENDEKSKLLALESEQEQYRKEEENAEKAKEKAKATEQMEEDQQVTHIDSTDAPEKEQLTKEDPKAKKKGPFQFKIKKKDKGKSEK